VSPVRPPVPTTTLRTLEFARLSQLLQTVFAPQPGEREIVIMVDLPTPNRPDTSRWMDRRRLAAEWYTSLQAHVHSLPFSGVTCCAYDNVGSNNGDLPPHVSVVERCTRENRPMPAHPEPTHDVLKNASVVIALTELSATAPLKLLARDLGFRGASMPGFTRAMLPTLMLDYQLIDQRVRQVKERLDRATYADVLLVAGGADHPLRIDLRHRTGHVSGGLIRENGTVANLPSGEAYIVPYEGERTDDPSATAGELPVQFNGEVVMFSIEKNKATTITSTGRISESQRMKLLAEPAYGNIAELGIGVLGEFGVRAMGETLVDEKLGLHIAFGRSDHFGGTVGPASFQNPKNVVHIDWVYVPSVQPLIRVKQVRLCYSNTENEVIIQDDKLLI
jgi:hypothetical protein